MKNPPSGTLYVLTIIALCVVMLGVIYLSNSLLLEILLSAIIVIAIVLVSVSYIRQAAMTAAISRIYDRERSRDSSISSQLVAELLNSAQAGASRSSVAAGIISNRLRIEKFAVFFREKDKFVPRIYGGFRPGLIKRPKISHLREIMKNGIDPAESVRHEEILDLLLKKNDWTYLNTPVLHYERWGRSNDMILVADDEAGMLSDLLSNDQFNRAFWPALYSYVQADARFSNVQSEKNRLQKELAAGKKDIAALNRDLNQKLSDLRSFVEVSGELYAIFSEEQLFKNLMGIIRSRTGAERAEILCSDGAGNFIPYTSKDSEMPELILDSKSGFFGLLKENPKPIMMPVVASGMDGDERFLNKAMERGFLIASGIRVDNQMGCVLLVSERKDGKRYTDSDLDFISTVTNIASLSLENIRQYTTIEKLSYTDSMTEVYNYRYFYKRLVEEILRARRFSRELALVILDIDNFKLFNDKYGHQTGDMVLRRLAGIVTETIRSIDVVSRYGGEEFCIIMPDTSAESCQIFIERLRREIADFRLESEVLKDDSFITVSIGGAVFPEHATNADRLIYCADMALLKAKASGRNTAVMYGPELTDKEESSIGGKL